MKKGKFRFFKEPADKPDYTLPRTRTGVFFDVVKYNWQFFICYGCVMLMVCLPMHFVAFSEAARISSINADYVGAVGDKILEQAYLIRTTRFMMSLLKIPCFMIISVFIAGFSKVIRQYVWAEDINFIHNFKEGLKTNVFHMLVLGFTVGVINSVVTYTLFSTELTDGVISFALTLPFVFAVLICVPIFAYAAVCISIYKNSIFGHLKMGMALFVKHPLKTYSAILLCTCVFFVQLIPNIYCMMIGRVASTLISPFVFLAWYLFTSNRLDSAVNMKRHPELVGKGTAKE